jgi:benzoyl-CoA reductase/2-hydroxyglutaryl-CoA dehydratase subunit BcrC/BadD/HgdB
LSGDLDKKAIVAELASLLESARPSTAIGSGKPVVGYFCSFVPPELLLAAGLYPLRLKGCGLEDSSSGDAFLSHLTCSFARHITAAVLDGHYNFLAGQISLNTCDHVRRANDVLVAKAGLGFNGYISVPRSFRQSLLPWYIEELERLQNALEIHFRVKVTNDGLRQAIRQTNQVRARIQALDLLRRVDEPRLRGSEMLAATVAARVLLPEDFIAAADRLLAAAQSAEPIAGIRGRVVLTGGPLDDPNFLRAVESQGAHVAGDLVCFGARGLGLRVEECGKPLHELARAYLHQIPCARMIGEFPLRYQALLELYHDCKAQGIIFQRLKFCQIWSADAHNLRHRLAENPLPLLILDREYGTVSTGQIKTRVQAFLERLGGQS